MNKNKHICSDCKADVSQMGDFCYIKDEIWTKIARKDEDLCISCIEVHLKRKLRSSDFTNCYINSPKWGTKSTRLLDRIDG